MTLFYIGASALLLLGLLFVLWPYIKYRISTEFRTQAETVDRQAMNVALYRDHLVELENSRKQGNIDQAQFDQLKQELERNLLEDSLGQNKGITEPSDDSSVKSKDDKPVNSHHLPIFIVAIILVPIASIFLYQYLGSSHSWQIKEQLQTQQTLESQFVASGGDSALENQLTALSRQIVIDLETHVTNNPDDLDSKVLFARRAAAIGQHDKAIAAYQQLLEAQPEAAQMMAELAQTVFIKANNRAVPIVGTLAQRALSIQPNNPMALGLMGIFTFQNADYRNAIRYWERAVSIYPPNSPNAQALRNGIVQARNRLIESSIGGVASADSEPNKTDDASKVASAVKVTVSLGKEVPVKPEHTVFIYARAWKGAKVPLAITRVKASELPLTLELDDSMSMAPGMNLSSADQVELVARLSARGNAIAQPGDWQATMGPVKPANATPTAYPLVISQPL